jgi:hypothetical protein
MEQYAPDLLQQLASAELIKGAIGAALTPDQQIAVSAKIIAGPGEFVAWSETDSGRAAVREFADKFAGGVK